MDELRIEDSRGFSEYRRIWIEIKNAKFRKAIPAILLIIIHYTILLILHISTETEISIIFFPIAYTAINVISNVRKT